MDVELLSLNDDQDSEADAPYHERVRGFIAINNYAALEAVHTKGYNWNYSAPGTFACSPLTFTAVALCEDEYISVERSVYMIRWLEEHGADMDLPDAHDLTFWQTLDDAIAHPRRVKNSGLRGALIKKMLLGLA